MKKLSTILIALLLLLSAEGQILRYSNYTAPTPPQASAEMVYNGTFDSADGWNTAGTMTISGGQVTWTSANPYATLTQLDIASEGVMQTLSANTTYDLSFTVVSYTGGSGAYMRFANSNNTVLYVEYDLYSVGNHTVSFTTPGTLDPTGIRILINNEESNTQVVFDNISIVAQ